jgi:hypothetical protein
VNSHWIQSNWALLLAAILALPAIIVVVRTLLLRSARGKLHSVLAGLHRASREFHRAEQRLSRSKRREHSLRQRAAKVIPRELQESVEQRSDADALFKIASDRLLIARNHVRRIILEEYAPHRQERLRRKYLPDDTSDSRPFSF